MRNSRNQNPLIHSRPSSPCKDKPELASKPGKGIYKGNYNGYISDRNHMRKKSKPNAKINEYFSEGQAKILEGKRYGKKVHKGQGPEHRHMRKR